MNAFNAQPFGFVAQTVVVQYRLGFCADGGYFYTQAI
jgi:hypothetical protein